MYFPPKPVIHKEYFQPLVRRNCACGARKTEVVAWGYYEKGRWHTSLHVCRACFVRRVLSVRVPYWWRNGTAQVVPRSGYSLPSWVTLPVETLWGSCYLGELIR